MCSDVLPWQCLTRYPGDCGGVKFVDVDFPDLIERKRQTVLGTPALLDMLAGVRHGEGLAKPMVLESEQYVQIGCDLRDLKTLQQGLTAAVGDLGECELIFVAEVSITYMEREGADEVVRWASTVGNGGLPRIAFHGVLDADCAQPSLSFWSKSFRTARATPSRRPC